MINNFECCEMWCNRGESKGCPIFRMCGQALSFTQENTVDLGCFSSVPEHQRRRSVLNIQILSQTWLCLTEWPIMFLLSQFVTFSFNKQIYAQLWLHRTPKKKVTELTCTNRKRITSFISTYFWLEHIGCWSQTRGRPAYLSTNSYQGQLHTPRSLTILWWKCSST